jgi:hypothetical protein
MAGCGTLGSPFNALEAEWGFVSEVVASSPAFADVDDLLGEGAVFED